MTNILPEGPSVPLGQFIPTYVSPNLDMFMKAGAAAEDRRMRALQAGDAIQASLATLGDPNDATVREFVDATAAELAEMMDEVASNYVGGAANPASSDIIRNMVNKFQRNPLLTHIAEFTEQKKKFDEYIKTQELQGKEYEALYGSIGSALRKDDKGNYVPVAFENSYAPLLEWGKAQGAILDGIMEKYSSGGVTLAQMEKAYRDAESRGEPVFIEDNKTSGIRLKGGKGTEYFNSVLQQYFDTDEGRNQFKILTSRNMALGSSKVDAERKALDTITEEMFKLGKAKEERSVARDVQVVSPPKQDQGLDPTNPNYRNYSQEPVVLDTPESTLSSIKAALSAGTFTPALSSFLQSSPKDLELYNSIFTYNSPLTNKKNDMASAALSAYTSAKTDSDKDKIFRFASDLYRDESMTDKAKSESLRNFLVQNGWGTSETNKQLYRILKYEILERHKTFKSAVSGRIKEFAEAQKGLGAPGVNMTIDLSGNAAKSFNELINTGVILSKDIEIQGKDAKTKISDYILRGVFVDPYSGELKMRFTTLSDDASEKQYTGTFSADMDPARFSTAISAFAVKDARGKLPFSQETVDKAIVGFDVKRRFYNLYGTNTPSYVGRPFPVYTPEGYVASVYELVPNAAYGTSRKDRQYTEGLAIRNRDTGAFITGEDVLEADPSVFVKAVRDRAYRESPEASAQVSSALASNTDVATIARVLSMLDETSELGKIVGRVLNDPFGGELSDVTMVIDNIAASTYRRGDGSKF